MSSTQTSTSTFTLTNAKYLSSKVATDLRRFHRLYGGRPTEQEIVNYELELTELLKVNAVASVVYGFKRNGVWTHATVKYESSAGGMIAVDDDPGKIRANLDVAGAGFTSFLSYSQAWWAMSEADRTIVKAKLPFSRTTMNEPGLESGNWETDLNYGAGGRALSRSTVKGA